MPQISIWTLCLTLESDNKQHVGDVYKHMSAARFCLMREKKAPEKLPTKTDDPRKHMTRRYNTSCWANSVKLFCCFSFVFQSHFDFRMAGPGPQVVNAWWMLHWRPQQAGAKLSNSGGWKGKQDRLDLPPLSLTFKHGFLSWFGMNINNNATKR